MNSTVKRGGEREDLKLGRAAEGGERQIKNELCSSFVASGAAIDQARSAASPEARLQFR